MLENEQLKITISKLDSDSHLKKIQDLNKKLDICKINLKKQITINEELENKVNCWQARENDLNKKLSETTIRLENIEKVIQNAATVIKNAVLVSNGYYYYYTYRDILSIVVLRDASVATFIDVIFQEIHIDDEFFNNK